MKLRPYQEKAKGLLHSYFQHNTGNPVMEAPTAAGKSVIQAAFLSEIQERWPGQRILCLTHVKELVSQNHNALRRMMPGADVGIYSASLKRRDTQNAIIFASIQSVHKRAHELGRFDLVIIDEAHLIPVKTSQGMYRAFLDACLGFNRKLKVIGFTATPYRLDNGLLIEGENRIFTDIIPAKASGMSIDDLLALGYLCPLTTTPVKTRLDVSGVHTRGGEYIPSELAAAVDVDATTAAACNEIISLGEPRERWLVFASSVQHASHIQDYLRAQGISTRTITGEMDGWERDDNIADFKTGSVRCLVNVNVLTTGFDVPSIDLLAFLRPTMSTSLYVQMAGRGMRIHRAKHDCLVLDFADLIATHGPVNKVTPPRHKKKGEDSQAPIKECKKCLMLIHAAARVCPYCGEEFQFDMAPKISGQASALSILATNEPEKITPSRVEFSRHDKPGKPSSLRVDYYSGPLRVASEWVCLFHSGGPRERALRWWSENTDQAALPVDIDHAVHAATEGAKVPAYLYVKQEGKFKEIISRGFNQ